MKLAITCLQLQFSIEYKMTDKRPATRYKLSAFDVAIFLKAKSTDCLSIGLFT
jgi:hypothetical protein